MCAVKVESGHLRGIFGAKFVRLTVLDVLRFILE